MEDKLAASTAAVAESPASSEPASSRRRVGGQKRKAIALSTSNSSSTPSKRLTREKAVIGHSPNHNGPLTRARQTPNNSPSFAAAVTANVKLEERVAAVAPDNAKAPEEDEGSKLEELEAAIEAEIEAIRSRDTNAHVVPSHCGWFSWTKVHPLEERALPSFFNSKFQTRTPDVYMEIRNWIMKKFHANPNAQIELKDLSELEVGDFDARQGVLEFLDYWGLINFHPFPQIDSAASAEDDEAAKKDSLLEKLFRFEAIQPCLPVVPKPKITMPAATSGLFPDSSIAEDLVRPEGPAVGYHCNSCSTDCSHKLYHCQKQADYDLCVDCFDNGKFGSDMSSSDFILMEPAEASGASGGNWTDQETLLLLEALELYKENWNEIAEHVATKTKAQCILHFIQMPIEDAFFDCSEEIDGSPKETLDPATGTDGGSGSKDVPEVNDGKIGAKEDQLLISLTEGSEQDVGEAKNCEETSKCDNVCEGVTGQGISKSEAMSERKASEDIGKNFVLQALTEAFEAVGYIPTPERQLSFAGVGNPVMALAAFLAKVVGLDVATAAARSSLKSLCSNSTGMQLAARHCFFLEDPPDNKKEQADFDCIVAELPDQDVEKDDQEDKNEKADKKDTSNGDSSPEEKKSVGSEHGDSTANLNTVNEASGAVTCEEVGPSSESKLQKDHSQTISEESDDTAKLLCVSTSVKDPAEGSSGEKHSELTEAAKNGDMGSDLKPSEKNGPCPSVASMSIEQPPQPSEASKVLDMVSDSFLSEKDGTQQPLKSNSLRECSKPTEIPKDVEMQSSLPSDVNTALPVASNSLIENGATAAEDKIYSKKEKPDCNDFKEDHSIDKIKNAAVSAVSAATVKAKFLADQEEDQIRQLALSLIEKQLHKLEIKLAFFNEMDGVIMRVREQLDRSRQRLYQERAQIIASRLGLPAAASRAMPSSFPANRIAMSFANSIARPPMSMTSQRPPVSRPLGMLAPIPNKFASTITRGSSMGHAGQHNISSVGTK